MNVAIHPDRRRQGIARDLIEQLFEETGPSARITLEVRVSNAPAIEMYERFGFKHAGRRRRYYHDNGEDALIMCQRPRQPGSKRGLAREMRILALETGCDDTCAAVVEGERILSSLVSSQAAFHESYGGVVPEVASHDTARAGQCGRRRGAGSSGHRAGRGGRSRGHPGPGAIGALLVGLSTAKARPRPTRSC